VGRGKERENGGGFTPEKERRGQKKTLTGGKTDSDRCCLAGAGKTAKERMEITKTNRWKRGALEDRAILRAKGAKKKQFIRQLAKKEKEWKRIEDEMTC